MFRQIAYTDFFIKTVLAGQSDSFNKLVDNSLKDNQFEVINRSKGREKRYPIGTTAIVDLNDVKYFLVALSKTDIKTLKARADVPELWEALRGLWRSVRNNANGYPINVALMGSGLSGVGLPPEQLLQIMIISVLNEAKRTEITSEIRIILTEDKFEDVDLETIKKDWR